MLACMHATNLPDWVQQMTSALDIKMELSITEVTPQRATGFMPVAGNTQPMGIWHGGATCVLAESLGSLAAHAHALTLGKVAVGIEINASHHRSTATGHVYGTATALRLGSSTATYQIELIDDHDKPIATARLTCFLLEAPKVGD